MPRILLIEPDGTLAAAIAAYLDDKGYKTIICHTSQQAIIEADHTKPDLVVIEPAMPKNNGLAFLQEFRSYTDWFLVPVIIYSKIPREDAGLSEAEWRKQGVADYLYKPTKTLANLATSISTLYENL